MNSSPVVSNPTTLPPVPCTAVLVQLRLRSGVMPASIFPHMAEEVRDTVELPRWTYRALVGSVRRTGRGLRLCSDES
jgi:hypothetical protein